MAGEWGSEEWGTGVWSHVVNPVDVTFLEASYTPEIVLEASP